MEHLKLAAGGDTERKGTVGGAGLVAFDLDHMISRGMGRMMAVGAFSTPIVGGGAGTILDQNQPEFAIGVPAGFCIRPIRVGIQVQTGLLATDSDETESLLAVDSLGLWTGDGTLTQENPSNMRSDLDKGSACKCGSAFTGDMTTTPGNGQAAAAPVLDMELSRYVQQGDVQGTAANAAWNYHNHLYEPKYAPYLVGPCTLIGYWGGTVATVGGFAQVAWVEGPTESFFK